MKKISKSIAQIVEIVLCIILLYLFFVKIFHEVAVLPGYTSEGQFITLRVDYYYSIIDNLKQNGLYLIHFSGAVIIGSIMINVIALIVNNNKLKIASHIVFGCSVTIFLIVLIIAAMNYRCY